MNIKRFLIILITALIITPSIGQGIAQARTIEESIVNTSIIKYYNLMSNKVYDMSNSIMSNIMGIKVIKTVEENNYKEEEKKEERSCEIVISAQEKALKGVFINLKTAVWELKTALILFAEYEKSLMREIWHLILLSALLMSIRKRDAIGTIYYKAKITAA